MNTCAFVINLEVLRMRRNKLAAVQAANVGKPTVWKGSWVWTGSRKQAAVVQNI